MPNIAENIRAIRENMAQAAKSAGRARGGGGGRGLLR